MRGRITRLLAVAVAASVGALTPSIAGASTPVTRPAALSDSYCAAVTDYYSVIVIVEFTATLASAFSELPGVEQESTGDEAETTESTTATTEPVDPDEIRASFLVVLSPKLEKLTADLSDEGPRILRPLFRRQRAAFARGVKLLKGAGLTDEQIDLIANAKIDQANAEIEDLSDDIDLDDAKVEELGDEFRDELPEINFEDITSRQERQLERVGSRCGAYPDADVDCEDALPQTDAEGLLGGTATLESEDRCEYDGEEPVEGQQPSVAVIVYGSTRSFDNLTGSIDDTEDVTGVGEQAVAFEGYSADGHGITCGRTLVVATEERTIVVALCLGDDTEVTDDQLVEIAQGAIDRIEAA